MLTSNPVFISSYPVFIIMSSTVLPTYLLLFHFTTKQSEESIEKSDPGLIKGSNAKSNRSAERPLISGIYISNTPDG